MNAPTQEQHSDAEVSSFRWVVLTLWMTGHVWGYVFLGSLGFLLPSIREELGLTPIQEGFLGSAPQIANIIFAVPFGWLLSRFRPKQLTSFSFFLTAGLVFFQGWAPVFLVLLFGRFLYGLASIAREPARTLLIRQWIPPKEIVIANALGNMLWGIVGLGFILVPLLLKLLDNSWRNTLFVFGGISLLVAFAWQIFGRERLTPEYEASLRSQEGSPLVSLFKYRELWLLGLGLMGIGINFSAFALFWPSLRLEAQGASLTSSAIAMGIGGAFASATGLGVGLLVSRIGKKRQILQLTGLILALSTVALLWIGPYSLLILMFLGQSLGWTFFPVAMTIPFELSGIKPREVAVAITSLYTMLWIGALVGPILAGVIQETTGDLRLALMITSLAAISMTVGGFLLPRKWDRSPAELRLQAS